VKTNEKIDLEKVLKVLSSFDQEIHWDDYWDTLEVIDANYSMWIPRLREALKAETEAAKLYALTALRKIGVNSQEMIPDALILLKDEDYAVRSEAIRIVANCRESTPEIKKALMDVVKSSKEYLGLRLRALWLLIK